MDVGRAFGLNDNKATLGVRIDLPDGGWIKVARENNPRYAKALMSWYKSHKVSVDMDMTSEAESLEANCVILATTILVAIGDLEDDNVPWEDTVEGRAALLLKHQVFREFVVAQSKDLALFQDEQDNAAGKVSASDSPGS